MNTLLAPTIQLLVPAVAGAAVTSTEPLFELYTWDPAHPQAQHGLVALGQHTADYEPGAATLLWLQYTTTNKGTVLSIEGLWPKEAPIVLIWRDDVAPQFSNQVQIRWSPVSGTLDITYPRSTTGPDGWTRTLTQARAFLAPTGGLLLQYDFTDRSLVGEWLSPGMPDVLPAETA